ncbi:MAG: cytochrome c oxidase subunit II [Aestuariivirga sp.]|uniref:cytochrome c oxidase subunit II n=1 Tax=Aestuariivirga sp. TaxID=2650926 RepID=UPI0030172597
MTFRNTLTAGLALAASVASAPAAWAIEGYAYPWQIGLQPSNSPSMVGIHSLHNYLLVVITGIVLFVLGLLIYVMRKFNARANPVPSRTTHNTTVEVAWTVIPIIILVSIAIPSFKLLYLQRDIPAADMTIKVIGNPAWNWTYEYPDLGLNDDGSAKVSFTASLDDNANDMEKAKQANVPYLLKTDNPVVVPVNKTVKLIVTSDPDGIIHAWTIPQFGMKIDAIPGRLNQDWFHAEHEGVFYGQCSELCGQNHAYMPIEVHVVSQADYDTWAKTAQTAGLEEAYKNLASAEAAEGQLAQK